LQPNSKIPEQSFAILSPRIVFKSNWNTHEAITIQYSRYMYNQRECKSAGIPGNPNAAAPPMAWITWELRGSVSNPRLLRFRRMASVQVGRRSRPSAAPPPPART